MLKTQFSYWMLLVVVGMALSCSTTKKGVLNRQYHALTTKYNVLFNGKEAYAVGEAILGQAFEENFFELLPVEPINLRGENFDATTIVPGFDRAEEKAVKAIQKHSIKIDENQYNSQIDEAYLLLGKARYFDRRFFPALEAFNFLLESGANPSVFTEGKIWREKTNMRLNNVGLAVENLVPLVKSLTPKNKFYPLANATLADAFIRLRQMDSAVVYIQRAAAFEPKRKNKARYLFISGQLLEGLNQPDSARGAYAKIAALKRKAPRNLAIQAKIKETLLTPSLAIDEKQTQLERLLNNYENEPFAHSIQSARARMYLEQSEDSLALLYFDKSLQAPTLDSYTEIQNYEALAAYYFDQGLYIETGQYLDRLLMLFDSSASRYKQLNRQRENLSDIILYEKTVTQTDSILAILALSKAQQLEYFQAYIDQKALKAKKELEAKEEEKTFQLLRRSSASFYFYNSNLILQGKQNYLARWGNRPNVDNWRSALAIESLTQVQTASAEDPSLKPALLQETAENFVTSLPQSLQERDSITALNHKAYLQLGLIYKEKFKNDPLAEERLSRLISKNPADEIKVQALYHLFRIASTAKSPLAAEYKSTLLEEFPQTPFAQLIADAELDDNSQLITPEARYKDILEMFQQQQFGQAAQAIEPLLILASGTSIEPKAALLRAHIEGRLKGVEAWKTALSELSTTYSASEEAKNALALLTKIDTYDDLKETGLVYKNYKWIFPFLSSEKEQTKAFFEEIQTNLKTLKQRWTVTLDPFNADYVFIVVHGIRDPQEVENVETDPSLVTLIQQNNQNFVALASQYRTILKNKNWKIPKDESIRDERTIQ